MPKNHYKISEIADYFHTTPETLRFYEKKGLISPQKSPENNYRYYTLNDMYRLVDIIFFRRLDMSLKEVKTILTEQNLDDFSLLLEQKKTLIETKIAEQQKLLKKLETYISQIAAIKSNLDQYCFKPFPPAYILTKEQGNAIQNTLAVSTWRHYELCQTLQNISITDSALIDAQLVFDQTLAQELDMLAEVAHLEIFSYPLCAYTIIKTAACIESEIAQAAQTLIQWLTAQNYTPKAIPFCNYLAASMEDGQVVYYYEIFAPCEKIL